MTIKRCEKCLQDKNEETDFYVQDKKTGKRMKLCKDCHNIRCKERYQAKREEILAKNIAYNHAHREQSAEAARRWREANPEKNKANQRRGDAKRKDNPDRKKAKVRYAQEYRQRHPDRILTSTTAYRNRNRDLLRERQRNWRLAHPESYRAIHAKWKAANKEKVNAATHRRRYALAKAPGFYTAAEWIALKTLCDNRCLGCGKSESELGQVLAFDHIVPVSKGGGNTIANAQPLCQSCNSQKHTKIRDLRPNWIRAIVETGLLLAPPEGTGGQTTEA